MLVLVGGSGTKIRGLVPLAFQVAQDQVKAAEFSSIEHLSSQAPSPDEIPFVLVEVAQVVEIITTERGVVVDRKSVV